MRASAILGRLAASALLALSAIHGTVAASASAAAPTPGAVTVEAPDPGTGMVTGRVSAVDPDGQPLRYHAPAPTLHGTVSVAPDGTFVYTPTDAARRAAAIPGAGPEATTDLFTVTVSDSVGRSLDVPVSVVVVPAGPAGLTFTFDYGEGSELWPPEARAALEGAAATLASYIVVAQPVSVNLAVTGIDSPGAPNIASAWVGFTGEGPGFYPTVVQNKILTGADVNGPEPDAVVTANFAEPWAFGGEVPADAYDFTSVVMHELLHALGFLSATGDLPDPDRHWNTYDSFLRAPDGTPVIDESFGLRPQFLANMTGGNGGLFFAGPNAVAAYGGPVPVFTPDPWASPSRSLSHVNKLPGYLMEPFYQYGPGVRVISPVELAILRDLGYTVNPPPA